MLLLVPLLMSLTLDPGPVIPGPMLGGPGICPPPAWMLSRLLKVELLCAEPKLCTDPVTDWAGLYWFTKELAPVLWLMALYCVPVLWLIALCRSESSKGSFRACTVASDRFPSSMSSGDTFASVLVVEVAEVVECRRARTCRAPPSPISSCVIGGAAVSAFIVLTQASVFVRPSFVSACLDFVSCLLACLSMVRLSSVQRLTYSSCDKLWM